MARMTLVWPWWLRALHWTLATAIAVALLTYHGGTMHEIAGYLVLGAAVVRAILGFAGPAQFRFTAFVRGAAPTIGYARALLAGRAPRYVNHTPLGAWMIVALLLFGLVGAGSGALYVTDQFWGEDWLIRLHSATTWIFVGLVPLHIAGVLHAGRAHRENLIRAMFDGRKRD